MNGRFVFTLSIPAPPHHHSCKIFDVELIPTPGKLFIRAEYPLWSKIMKNRILYRQRGQGLPEYALLIALISLLLVVVVVLFGQSLSDAYTDVIWMIEPVEIEDPNNPNPLDRWQVARITAGGNQIGYRIRVNQPTNLTITDSQTGQTHHVECSRICSGSFPGAGPDAGTVTIIGNGVSTTVPYPAK
jgi:Flp pilus assembly pilin Flp